MAPVVFGPTNFFYNPAANQFHISDAADNIVRTGINANLRTGVIVGLEANINRWFQDWDTSGRCANGDCNDNWSVPIPNTTATNLTCTIRIEDRRGGQGGKTPARKVAGVGDYSLYDCSGRRYFAASETLPAAAIRLKPALSLSGMLPELAACRPKARRQYQYSKSCDRLRTRRWQIKE